MIDLSPVEKQIRQALAQIRSVLPGVLTIGGGDAADLRNAEFYLRGLDAMVIKAAAGREEAARPVLDAVQRGADIQTEGGHRVSVANADQRTVWVVRCMEGDYNARDADRDRAVNLAERHSLDTVAGAAIRG